MYNPCVYEMCVFLFEPRYSKDCSNSQPANSKVASQLQIPTGSHQLCSMSFATVATLAALKTSSHNGAAPTNADVRFTSPRYCTSSSTAKGDRHSPRQLLAPKRVPLASARSRSSSANTASRRLFLLVLLLLQVLPHLRLANSSPISARSDLNLGPSELSEHLWTSTWDLPSSVSTAGPQRPDRMPEDMPGRTPDSMSDRMPEDMPDKMPEDMPDRMPDGISDTVPECLPD